MFQTGTLVRTEGIITHLVFEHSLRIRMKSSTSESKSGESTAVVTPDSASIAESPPSDDQGEGNDNASHSVGSSADETVRPGSPSTKSGDSVKGKGKSATASLSGKSVTSTKSAAADDKDGKSDNLVGKLNNLVTTDLNNITEARDFMLVGL